MTSENTQKAEKLMAFLQEVGSWGVTPISKKTNSMLLDVEKQRTRLEKFTILWKCFPKQFPELNGETKKRKSLPKGFPFISGDRHWSEFFQRFLKLIVHKVGVNLGGGDVAVAEGALDDQQVRGLGVEVSGKGVAQTVRRDGFEYFRSLEPFLQTKGNLPWRNTGSPCENCLSPRIRELGFNWLEFYVYLYENQSVIYSYRQRWAQK